MAHLSTRHNNKQTGVLNSELCKSMIARETPTECTVQNQGLYRIGNLADMAALRKLDIAFNPIENLDGLDQCPQLRHFNCYSSKLINIEGLRGVKRLETLFLQQNGITALCEAFSAMQKLKDLRLDRNQLQSLDKCLVSCTSLKTLDLSYNRLTSLEGLSGLQCLEELRVTNNNLKSLRYLKGLPALLDLDVSYNQCKTLDGLEFLPTLQVLRAAHNHIGTLKIPMTYSQQHSSAKTLIADENAASAAAAANSNSSSNSNSTGQLNSAKRQQSSSKAHSTGSLLNRDAANPAKQTTTIVGLQYLTEVYLAGNRLKSFDGLSTLGSNIEVLDFSSNKLTAQALLQPPAVAAAGLGSAVDTAAGGDAALGGLHALCAQSKLKEVRLTMNPVSDDVRSMQAITFQLRSSCGSLEAVDGTSFVNGGASGRPGWKLTGVDDEQDGAPLLDDDGNVSVISHATKNTTGKGGAAESIKSAADSDEDDLAEEDDEEEEEGPREDDDGLTLDEKGNQVKREPKLRAKISKKGIKTMEQIEAAESAIRTVFASSKQILQSIFLLDDTVDGLFSSVEAKDLPTGNEQFAKILFASQLHPIPKVPAAGGAPVETAPGILSPHAGMAKAVADLRAAKRRAALAVGEEWVEEEGEEGAQGLGGGSVNTTSVRKNQAVVDGEGSVHMQHNVTVYTTQAGIEVGSPAAVKGNRAHRSMLDMLEGGSDLDDDDAEEKGEGRGGGRDHKSSVDHLPGFRPLEMDRPATTNKQKVHTLVQNIKAQVEAELAAMSVQESRQRIAGGGTVGVTTRPAHDMDLPVGSGLTRFGSKIRSAAPAPTVGGGGGGAGMVKSPDGGGSVGGRSVTQIPSPVGASTTLSSSADEYDMKRSNEEIASKLGDDQKALWKNVVQRSPILSKETAAKESGSGSGSGSPATRDEYDRKALQEAIDRRLGFSLTNPKSPVPSRGRGGAGGGDREALSSSSASRGGRSYENGIDSPRPHLQEETEYAYSDLVSPRVGAFDKFQITAARPNSSGAAAQQQQQLLFSQTFDPRFMGKDPDQLADVEDAGYADAERYGPGEGEGEGQGEGEVDDYFSDEVHLSSDAQARRGVFQPFSLPLHGVGLEGADSRFGRAMNDDDDDDDTGAKVGAIVPPAVTVSQNNTVASGKMTDLLNARRALTLGVAGPTGAGLSLGSGSLPTQQLAAFSAANAAISAAAAAASTKGASVSSHHSALASPMARSLLPASSSSSSSVPKFRPPLRSAVSAGLSRNSDVDGGASLEDLVLRAATGHLSPRP